MAIERSRIGAKLARTGVSHRGLAETESARPCETLCETPVQVQCETLARPLNAGSNEPNDIDFARPIFKNYLRNSDSKVELNLKNQETENKKVVFENGSRIALNRAIARDSWGRQLRVTGHSECFLNFQTKTGPVVLPRERADTSLSFGYLHQSGGIWRQTFNTLEAMKDSENLYLIKSAPYAHVKPIKITQLMKDVAEVFSEF